MLIAVISFFIIGWVWVIYDLYHSEILPDDFDWDWDENKKDKKE
jgi:hypothetical protein